MRSFCKLIRIFTFFLLCIKSYGDWEYSLPMKCNAPSASQRNNIHYDATTALQFLCGQKDDQEDDVKSQGFWRVRPKNDRVGAGISCRKRCRLQSKWQRASCRVRSIKMLRTGFWWHFPRSHPKIRLRWGFYDSTAWYIRRITVLITTCAFVWCRDNR